MAPGIALTAFQRGTDTTVNNNWELQILPHLYPSDKPLDYGTFVYTRDGGAAKERSAK
jgi:hypothetical protein